MTIQPLKFLLFILCICVINGVAGSADTLWGIEIGYLVKWSIIGLESSLLGLCVLAYLALYIYEFFSRVRAQRSKQSD